MNAMFEGYGSRGPAYDEMFDGERAAPAVPAAARLARRDDHARAGRPGRGAAGQLPRPGRHLRHRRRGAGVPARHPAAGHRDGHLVDDRRAASSSGCEALEPFLADVYDAGQVFDDGVIPRRVITTSSHFHRAAAGVRPPNGVRVHVSGIDLIRDNDGEFRVLEDNVRVPSGVSYVMTNRRAISAALPETFAEHRIRPVAGYPQRLLAALRAAAPAGVADPTVVVLTPGRLQRRLLRARAAGPHDGRRAGRGPRPGVPPRPGDDADHQGPGAGARDLPPGRRRVPRPGALPGRLDARLPRADRRRPGRQRHARQRGRQRRRRRQARLHLHARPDPLLPRRGAGAPQRRHLAAGRRRRPARRCSTGSTSWCSSRSTAPAARAS